LHHAANCGDAEAGYSITGKGAELQPKDGPLAKGALRKFETVDDCWNLP
jgi:hypothetical protein